MENQARLGAALLGGYVLGRTKKGGFAIRLATRMFLSGSNTDPKELARERTLELLESDIVLQLRGQIMEAARAAANARVEAFASNITQRTEAIKSGTSTVTDTAEGATDTVTGVTEKVTGKESDEEPEESAEEDTEADESADESEPEAEADEADSSEEEPDDEPEEDEGEGDESEDEDLKAEAEERRKELSRKRIGTLRNIAVDLGFDKEEMDDLDDKTEIIDFIMEAEEEDRQKGKK